MRHVSLVLLVLALVACAGTDEKSSTSTAAPMQEYADWIGRNIDEMIEAYGEPSWSREYKSAAKQGGARWYDRRRSAGVGGRHVGTCWMEATFDQAGTVILIKSSNNRYCGPSRTNEE
ncbi:MAG: hypothetical protein GWP69_22025 [Gammaproteobacteria bacterium]|jgi:hypothetical protein|nr:hypothetical protein [Gammaproteobacteria bacterium]